jgi:hypothetical protein
VLGFTIDEIRTLLALGGPEKASCADVREVATKQDRVADDLGGSRP